MSTRTINIVVAALTKALTGERITPTIPLEIGEGDGPAGAFLVDDNGQRFLPPGTEVYRLRERPEKRPKGYPANQVRVLVKSGERAGAIGYVTSSMIQARRKRE